MATFIKSNHRKAFQIKLVSLCINAGLPRTIKDLRKPEILFF